MEVLEKVGTPEQKEKWLKPLLNGEIRSAFAMTEPRRRLVGRQEHRQPRRARRRRVGDQRREVLHLRRRRSALQDHDHHGARPAPRPRRSSSSRRSWCRSTRRASKILGPMNVFGHDDAPHGHMHLKFDERAGCRQENILLGEGRGFEISQVRLGPGPHPSLHALDRRRREGARPDGQARLDPHRLRQAADPARQEPRGWSPRAASRSRPCA